MARDFHLQLNMSEASVPGLRRVLSLFPLPLYTPNESDEGIRQRIHTANATLGRKPDGNPAKLWLAVSQPPERRRRAALAGKVKRLIIKAEGDSMVPRMDPEGGNGADWFKSG